MRCKFGRLLYPKTLEEAEDGSYMIAIFYPQERVLDSRGNALRSVKVVGHFLPTVTTLVVDLTGHWKKDGRYGLQFEAESYEEVIRPGRDGIVQYLSCGLIKGIGPKLASRIYEQFGDNVLQILDESPGRLAEVSGIGEKKCKRLIASYQSIRSARKIIALLAPLDIKATQAIAVQKELGPEALAILTQHPYQAYERGLISFQAADQLAANHDISPLAPERIDAGLLHTLERNEGKGHLCMQKHDFIREATKLLSTAGLTRKAVADRAFEMLKSGRLVLYKDFAYRPIMAQAEAETAARIQGMLRQNKLPYIGDIDESINRQQETMGITLAREQRNAVQATLSSPICIISGGPGTGKTSIQKVFLNIYQQAFPDAHIICCAPTGRAARRMEESTGFPACTVHKALGLESGDLRELKKMEFLNADLVLVDEVSMVDMLLAWHLLQAIPPGCRLILVGDVDQLPSVGPGAVLSELLKCERIPRVILDKVFRQDAGSRIAVNAQRIKHGNTDLLIDQSDDCFQFLQSADAHQSATWLQQLYLRVVAQYGVDNVALLTPFREKTETGVRLLNPVLREMLNPESPGKAELNFGQRIYRQGDKVMQIRNREDVSNGDIGYIYQCERNEDGISVLVDYRDGRIAAYEDAESLRLLDLAYAMTIHKSQGSEYDAVLINIQNYHGRMLKRSIIYTAITRAKRRVFIVGDWEALMRAIETEDTELRNTFLADRTAALGA